MIRSLKYLFSRAADRIPGFLFDPHPCLGRFKDHPTIITCWLVERFPASWYDQND